MSFAWSSVRVRRVLFPSTPAASPGPAYFTPLRSKHLSAAKKTSKSRSWLKVNSEKQTVSARRFRARQQQKKKFGFYQKSPSCCVTPSACKEVRRTLNFEEEEHESTPNNNKQVYINTITNHNQQNRDIGVHKSQLAATRDKQQHTNGTTNITQQNSVQNPSVFAITYKQHNINTSGSEQQNHLQKPNVFVTTYNNQHSLDTTTNYEQQSKSNVGTFKHPGTALNVPACSATLSPAAHQLLMSLSPVTAHKPLGRGRFGTVIAAVYKGVPVAVKVIQQAMHRLPPGERNLVGRRHPRLVNILSVIETVGRCCVLMESQRGSSLYHVIHNQHYQINFTRIIRYALDMCEAVSWLHSEGILHLDIKPRNVLLGLDDRCKLCDFGSSILIKDTKNQTNTAFPGTIQYCAPELLKNCSNSLTDKADVYSLGVTLWQLRTREEPYGKLQLAEHALLYGIATRSLRPEDSHLYEHIQEHQFCGVYRACWREQASERPTAKQMYERLKQIAHHL